MWFKSSCISGTSCPPGLVSLSQEPCCFPLPLVLCSVAGHAVESYRGKEVSWAESLRPQEPRQYRTDCGSAHSLAHSAWALSCCARPPLPMLGCRGAEWWVSTTSRFLRPTGRPRRSWRRTLERVLRSRRCQFGDGGCFPMILEHRSRRAALCTGGLAIRRSCRCSEPLYTHTHIYIYICMQLCCLCSVYKSM